MKNVLDVGSGTGDFSSEFKTKNIIPTAVEHSPFGRKMAIGLGVNCLPFDLTKNPPAEVVGPFDLVYCFEVAEHLPKDLGNDLVKFIASFKSPVVFTAAHPGQGGTGHINEQPTSYWINAFEKCGLAYDAETSSRLKRNFDDLGASLWFGANVIVLKPIL